MNFVCKIILHVSLLSSITFASQYVVISNKNLDVKDLTKSQIKAIYLKKLTMLKETKLVPINLGTQNNLRGLFEEEVLNISFARLKHYWTSQHYLGHRPPLSLKSQQAVKAFVKKVDGAVGYIELDNIDDDVKVIYKWEK